MRSKTNLSWLCGFSMQPNPPTLQQVQLSNEIAETVDTLNTLAAEARELNLSVTLYHPSGDGNPESWQIVADLCVCVGLNS